MKRRAKAVRDGFTVVELVIVIVVIGILAAISVVSYNGVQKHGAAVRMQDTAKDAAELVDVEKVMSRSLPTALPATFTPPSDVDVRYVTASFVRYSNLTPVQNGVLFHGICTELIADPYYRTIHAKSGGATNSVVYDCDTDINDNNMMIRGWDSPRWNTPVTKANIESYITNVPYDAWWTDKQTVIRAFYTELMNRYTQRGGVWPITSFWEPDANQYWGVPKEELPVATGDMYVDQYCIEVVHKKYTSLTYYVTSESKAPAEGVCNG